MKELRKVRFNRWIPQEMEKSGKRFVIKEGTNCYEKTFQGEGHFIDWALECDEVGSYTVALVQLPDGTVKKVFIENIKFV